MLKIPNLPFDKNRVPLLVVVFLIILIAILAARQLNLFPRGSQPRIQPVPVSPKPETLQKGPYNCPSIPEFCQNAKPIERDGYEVGLGAQIPPDSPIFAAFDGELSTLTSYLNHENNKEQISTIYLDNAERGLRAVYHLSGPAEASGSAQAGTRIGTVRNRMVYYDSSLVFSMIRNYPSGGIIKLSPQDFKQ